MRLDGSRPDDVAAAAERLAAGELIAFPTETVYGLGARADDDAAVAQVYALKGRPRGHPLIVHVADAAAADAFTAGLPALAQRLTARLWPGPLTVIVARRPGVAEAAAGGTAGIALRCPSHPVALALLRAAAGLGVAGVAAPSANRFGRLSPTTADHVAAEFGERLAVLDGGACAIGIESAIVDCSRGRPVLLRPGQLTRREIEAAAGEPLHDADADAPRAPGTLASHYAPSARLRLLSVRGLRDALAVLADAVTAPVAGAPAAPTLAVYSRSVPPAGRPWLYRRMPDNAGLAAQELFAVLRGFDDRGAALIWVEAPPAGAEWDGVRDRLERAAAG